MANKKRKTSEIQLNIDLPKDLERTLVNFCDVAKMKKKAVVELALRRWLNDRRATL